MQNTIYIESNKVPMAIKSPLIAITFGELGFTPIYSNSDAAYLNGEEVDESVVQSALEASMFGWNTPAAKSAVEYFTQKGSH